MKPEWDRDQDELNDIRRRLSDSSKFDLEEAQELYFRKNFLESGLAADEQYNDLYGDEDE